MSELRNDLARLELALDQWHKQIAGARSVWGERMARIHDRFLSAGGEARSRDGNVRTVPLSAQLDTLQKLLTTERQRSERLQRELDALPASTPDSLSERLSNTLRDRDEAHQEIVSLRAELAALQRANATLTLANLQKQSPLGGPARGGTAGMRRLRLGEMLIDLGFVTAEQVQDALDQQQTPPPRPMGTILVDAGVITEPVLAEVLARQLDLPFVKLDPDTLDIAAVRVIPAHLARQYQCLAIALSPERVIVAMSNPMDLAALDELEAATGRRVTPVVAAASDMAAALKRFYSVT